MLVLIPSKTKPDTLILYQKLHMFRGRFGILCAFRPDSFPDANYFYTLRTF